MDAARKIDPSYSHALCLPFYVAFFRVHYSKDICAGYYSLRASLNLIGRVYYSLLPS
jgi:hypothetical protein